MKITFILTDFDIASTIMVEKQRVVGPSEHSSLFRVITSSGSGSSAVEGAGRPAVPVQCSQVW